MEQVNIGVVGTGTIAGCHLKAYAGHPRVELVAVCDINADRATAVASSGVPPAPTATRRSCSPTPTSTR